LFLNLILIFKSFSSELNSPAPGCEELPWRRDLGKSLNYCKIQLMYKLIKPLLFLLSPENAHQYTMQLFRFALRLPFSKKIFRYLYCVENQAFETKVLGLNFPNPIGLAAGFDKNGKYFDAMKYLGFGFVEIGTITPKPQDGNPKPRLFRLPKDQALINRMGFNNAGADELAQRLANRKKDNTILGINIGKNKNTPNENADADYIYCFEKLFPYADYFVVNVSSPNTPDLRALQDKKPLLQLLSTLQNLNNQKLTPKPILLKIAPDLNDEQLDDVIDILKTTKLAGVIATNTTIDRSQLATDTAVVQSLGAGGVSGFPVKKRSTEVIHFLRKKLDKEVVIIGVGGIQTYEDAKEKLDAGANLIQIYTGLVYEGPSIVKKCLTDVR
jgi:dihydroorotate dehydrogenase